MSQPYIPRSSIVAARPETGHRSHPTINASSHRVVPARERRERLLAYHTAVRLLENCGLRSRPNTASADSGIEQRHEVSSFFGAVEQSVAAFGCDPVLERVQQAVAAYEEEHQRQMHEAISLNFVDDRGNLIDVTPASTPRAGSTSPRAARATRPSPPSHRRANMEVVAKVREVLLSGGGFSFFESKKKQLLTNRQGTTSASESNVPGSSIMPPTQLNIAAMKDKVSGVASPVAKRPMFSPGVPNLELPHFGKPTADSLLSLGISLQLPGEGSHSKISNPFERQRYSDAEATAARECATARLKQCIANTARTQTFPEYRATTTAEPQHPDRDPREWLSQHPSIFQAVRATTDLIVFTLMKALPVCLFAGDDMRFAELLAEEYVALHHIAAATTAKTISSVTAEAPSTPTTQRTLAAQCDELVLDLQQRSSQRAERALSHGNANRLFLLLEVEQATSESHLSRLRYTAPGTGAPAFDLSSGRLGGGSGKQQLSGTMTGSASRRTETIEIERERRKREAKRPPRDPLQAAASQNQRWLSLTTSKMKQMPLHACALDSAVAGETPKSTTTEDLSGSQHPAVRERTSDTLLHPSVPRGVEPRSPAISDVARGKPGARVPSAASHSTGHSIAPRFSNDNSAAAAGASKISANRSNTSTFAYPEATILPVVDLMVALASGTTGNDGCGGSLPEHNLQERLGPVELRLLLEVADAYAALVQSLHADRGSIYGRFLEQHRDYLQRAAAEVIAQASLEYMTHFIASKDGTRGLYRPALESTSPAAAASVQSSSTTQAAGSILATLRPFGRRVALSKPQVEAILAATGHHAGSGEVLVGNDRDAQRAAVHQLEQNRSVLHEVLARVKGELLFLLTGVDSRTRILEQELIAIEERRRERAKTRKLRESSSAAGWRVSEATAVVGHAASSHPFSRQPRGVDMIGPTNKVRFRALLEDMVGSSSEEDEALHEPASGDDGADLIPPVFDWQRQNFDVTRPAKRRGYHRAAESPSRCSPERTSPPRQKHAQPSSERDRSPSVRGDTDSTSPRLHRGQLGSRTASVRPRALSPSVLGGSVSTLTALQSPPVSALAMRAVPVTTTTMTTQSPRVPQAHQLQLQQQPQSSTTASGKEVEGPSSRTPNLSSTAAAPLIPPTPPALATPKTQVPPSGRNKRVSLVLGEGQLPRSIEQAKAESAIGALREAVQNASPRASLVALVGTESTPEDTALTPLQSTAGAVLPRPPPAPKMDGSAVSTAAARPNKTRAFKGLMLGMASSTTQHGGAPPPSHVGGGEKAKVQVRVPEHLTMVALQRELLVLERNRRRASRSAPAGSRSPSPKKGSVTERPLTTTTGTVDVDPAEEGHHSPTKHHSLTEEVVGPQHAMVVEKFKQACSATIQHLYGATAAAGKNEGSAWYEQGRPCTAARSERASAVRGMQRGRFDLAALTPIAALRLAVSSTVDIQGAVKAHQQPTITYATHHHHHHGGTSHELPWTV